MSKKFLTLSAIVLAFVFLAAACGNDDDVGTAAAPTSEPAEDPPAEPAEAPAEEPTEAPAEEPTEAPAEEPTIDPLIAALDANGDGEVRIGVAAQGPRDDGGYYEALIAEAEQLSADNGFGEVIVVDNISFEEAATELDNLANQPVDIILVGASGVAGPLADLASQYSDQYWYCNCGAGFPASDDYAQTQDEGAGIHYTAGVAFGLALQEAGGDTLAVLGCCDLAFETEMILATELGLQSVDPNFQLTYTPTGDFPFDFDNVANATAAFDAAVANGADAIYPFLGGALEPVAQLAVDAGLIVANPGSSSACGGPIDYTLQVRFDGGDYVSAVFPDIVSGNFPEGSVRVFTVGTDPDIVGGELCDPTAEQTAALTAAYDLVASGALDGDIGAIKGQAYGG